MLTLLHIVRQVLIYKLVGLDSKSKIWKDHINNGFSGLSESLKILGWSTKQDMLLCVTLWYL